MAEKKKSEKAIEFDEARNLPQKDRVAGLRVKGSTQPFGGRWEYDEKADELTLVEPPTAMP